ncbi:hypothetical protein WJX77_010826 [Trebouxia sp. C0004]
MNVGVPEAAPTVVKLQRVEPSALWDHVSQKAGAVSQNEPSALLRALSQGVRRDFSDLCSKLSILQDTAAKLKKAAKKRLEFFSSSDPLFFYLYVSQWPCDFCLHMLLMSHGVLKSLNSPVSRNVDDSLPEMARLD